MKWKRSTKISFIWWFNAYTYSHWLWKVVLSKPSAHIQKPAVHTYRGTNQEDVIDGVACAAPKRSRKCDKSRVFAAFWWGHVSSFNAWPCDASLVPPL